MRWLQGKEQLQAILKGLGCAKAQQLFWSKQGNKKQKNLAVDLTTSPEFKEGIVLDLFAKVRTWKKVEAC